MNYSDILSALDLQTDDGDLSVVTPIDGTEIAKVRAHTVAEAQQMFALGNLAFKKWRLLPAPRRGELIRIFGEELRTSKESLGRLVSLECGKILQEGLGEVQEVIDVCDLALGQSRQLFGLTVASERPQHAMRELWHPLGLCGVITAFNFPVAPWGWNFALALVCGNPVLWKPSEKTPLTALAVQKIFARACKKFSSETPKDLLQVVIGGADIGDALAQSTALPVVSATGSTRMGRVVGKKVAARFGRTILELGGNNAMIVTPAADLELALRAIVFSAVGTCGQRCTTLRRLIVHEDIYNELLAKLNTAYQTLVIGNPLDDGVLVGPMIDASAYNNLQTALKTAKDDGATISGGDRVCIAEYPNGYYVRPAIVKMPTQSAIVKQETFAPILYAMKYRELKDAIALQNDVPQGLSSCIFSTDVRETEIFLSAVGSDCGIANVNIGPSGAEVGGAFGGEKETGGGRETGSDAWKGYMRRQTATVNYSRDLPLAQGIKFDV